jgi:hypothetical protein
VPLVVQHDPRWRAKLQAAFAECHKKELTPHFQCCERLVAMNHSIGKFLVALLVAFALVGCSSNPSGPASVAETSAARAELTDRVRFIERYVTFRRNYEELDYDVIYANNSSGMVPGPSDWDIRLIAVVPKAEIVDWVPAGADKTDGPAPEWLKDIPGAIERAGITEWYRKSGTVVGIDRGSSIVAYRNTSTPD